MRFRKKLTKMFIRKNYNNDETCTIPEKIININSSQILETKTNHATEYDEKWVCTEKFRYHKYI